MRIRVLAHNVELTGPWLALDKAIEMEALAGTATGGRSGLVTGYMQSFYTPNCKNVHCEYYSTVKSNNCERTDIGEDPRDCPMYMATKANPKFEWVEFRKTRPHDTRIHILHSKAHGVSTGWYSILEHKWFFHDHMATGGGYYLEDITHWRDLPEAPDTI